MNYKCNPCVKDQNRCPQNCDEARKEAGLMPFPRENTDMNFDDLHKNFDNKPYGSNQIFGGTLLD